MCCCRIQEQATARSRKKLPASRRKKKFLIYYTRGTPASLMRMKIVQTAQIGTINHKTGLNIHKSEVLVLPVHSQETRPISFQTRLVSFLSRRVSRETRLVSRDSGNLPLSGTVLPNQSVFNIHHNLILKVYNTKLYCQVSDNSSTCHLHAFKTHSVTGPTERP